MDAAIRSRFPEFEGIGLTEQQMLAYNRYRFWRICIMSAVWYSFYYLGRLNWGFCLPWIIDDLHITKIQAGMGASAILWGYAIGVFLSGRLADRYGARIMDTVGGVGTTIMNVVVATLTGFQFILGSLFVNGLLQGQGYASTNGMITQWYPKEKRGRATGYFCLCYGHFDPGGLVDHRLLRHSSRLARGVHVPTDILHVTGNGHPVARGAQQTRGCQFSTVQGDND